MKDKIIQCYLTKNKCYKQAKKRTKVSGIVRHSTGANNPSLSRYIGTRDELGENRYGNHWNQEKYNGKDITKCVHFMIGKDKSGKVKCYQTLPLDYTCWGSGSGAKGSYNSTHIQYEILEDDLKDAKYYKEAFALADQLDAYLCEIYKLKPSAIVSHNEARINGYATQHFDCDHWMAKHGDSMEKARQRVKKLLENETNTVAKEPSDPVAPLKISNSIKEVQRWLNEYYGAKLTVDGKFGSKTRDAFVIALKVELNKSGCKLSISSTEIGDLTKKGINNYAIVKKGSKGIYTTIFQALLLCNDIKPNGIDGVCGDGCVKAIKAYQSKKKLSQDGCSGASTWTKILTE